MKFHMKYEIAKIIKMYDPSFFSFYFVVFYLSAQQFVN